MTSSIIQKLGRISLLIFFPMLLLRRWITLKGITIILVGLVLTGCFQYYFRTATRNQLDLATLQRLRNSGRYFIIHTGDSIVALQNMELQDNVLEGDLAPVEPSHLGYMHPRVDKTNRVRRKDKSAKLIEVHLYASSITARDQKHIAVPLSSFDRIDVYEYDKGATTANHVFSWVGVAIVSGFAIAMIAFLIACNCPQVYACNDGQCAFKSGVYSGAIYAGLERADYLPLEPPIAGQKKYQFRISNVADEVQFINHLSLLQVDHPAGTHVLADRTGRLLTYVKPVQPITAADNNNVKVTGALLETDDHVFSFDSRNADNGRSYVDLTFEKPAGAQTGKLIVHAGNSPWSGYVFHQFISLFGNRFEAWRDKQEQGTRSKPEQWQLDQNLPLKVYVETQEGWKYVNYFAATGNTASRDMVMSLDLSAVASTKVRVRIETVYRFWDLDQVAMDFSPERPVATRYLSPVSVVRNDGEDEGNLVATTDSLYCHLANGQFINVAFNLSETADFQRSYFLVSSGYYHTASRSRQPADQTALLKFQQPGVFDQFSRTQFQQVYEQVR